MMYEKPKEMFWELLKEVNLLLADRRDAEAVPAICEACYLLFEVQPEYGDWGDEKFDLIMLLSGYHKRRLVN